MLEMPLIDILFVSLMISKSHFLFDFFENFHCKNDEDLEL